MTKSYLLALSVFCSLILYSFTIPLLVEDSDNTCPEDVAVSDIVIGSDLVVAASGTILSSQSILEGSNVYYLSGSGTSLSYGMTGSLTGPSPTFQIFKGSTLTVEIVDCTD